MLKAIIKTAIEYGCEFKENAPMSEYTSFKTGGAASLIVMPGSEQALSALVSVCKQNDIKMYVIGNGSNVLVSDNGLNGVVIRIGPHMSDVQYLGNGRIMCEAGVSLAKLCTFALNKNLSGLEFACGIPGTAGGAAYMNAGAYGGEMKDVLVACSYIDRNGNNGVYTGDELKLGYRKSIFTNSDYIITALSLQLKLGNYDEIKASMNDKLSRRKEKQPLEFPSAGSTFKRPEGNFAGALIEKNGLKGFSIGGAQVSEKHAGFVINKGGATTNDILELIKHIRNTVYENDGIMLEPEVKILK